MPYMTLVMIEVAGEPSVSKVRNMQTNCCRDDVQTCEPIIYSRNRYRFVWWKPIGVLLFYSIFDEAIKKKIEDPHRKLTRLTKYTTGGVKEMIKNCMQLPSKEEY